jgi:hypothetical protein
MAFSTVANYAALILLTPSPGDVVLMEGYYTPADAGSGTFCWNASSTATPNAATIVQPSAGGVGRWIRISEAAVDLKWYGAKGDGSDESTRLAQAFADWRNFIYRSDIDFGAGYKLNVNPGVYCSSTTQNLVSNNPGSVIEGMGRPTLKHTGSGLGFDMVQTVGSGLGPEIKNLRFQGNANTTRIVRVSTENRLNWAYIDFKDCSPSYEAVLFENLILCNFMHLTCGRAQSEGCRPGGFIVLGTGTGSTGQVTCSNFYGAVGEGVGIAFHLVNAVQCGFIGGTAESCVRGVQISAQSWGNVFDRTDCESNDDYDFLVEGYSNSFRNCIGTSPYGLCFTGSACNRNIVTGGIYSVIDSYHSSGRNVFDGVRFRTTWNPHPSDKWRNILNETTGVPIPDNW